MVKTTKSKFGEVARESVKISVLVYSIIALTYLTSGHTLDHYARNSYTFEPIEDVYVVVMNNETGVNLSDYSDSTGHTQYIILSGNYTTYAYKPTYNERITSFEIIDDETRISYLSTSTTSYVKLSFADMTLNKHEWCFYIEGNNHLLGCYRENDTILLSPDQNYTTYPKLTLLDQLGLLDIGSFLAQISILLIVGISVIAFIIAFIAVGVYLIWRRFK